MKNILLIGGSTGIGYELSQKLKEDNNVFIATRNQEKFSDTNIKTNELNLDQEFETDWLALNTVNALRFFGCAQND